MDSVSFEKKIGYILIILGALFLIVAIFGSSQIGVSGNDEVAKESTIRSLGTVIVYAITGGTLFISGTVVLMLNRQPPS